MEVSGIIDQFNEFRRAETVPQVLTASRALREMLNLRAQQALKRNCLISSVPTEQNTIGTRLHGLDYLRALRDLPTFENSKRRLILPLLSQAHQYHDLFASKRNVFPGSALVVGAGPAGLREAIQFQLMDVFTSVVLWEKRKSFTRNNVLHLWRATLDDMKALGVPFFLPGITAGSIHHVSIRRLQIALLKIALICGVDVKVNCGFVEIPKHRSENGLRSVFGTNDAVCTNVSVLVAADGEHSFVADTLGMPYVSYKAGAAIGITCNFVRDKKSKAERVDEQNIVCYANRPLFERIADTSGLKLENLVYFRDATHYLVLACGKDTLIDCGVFKSQNRELSAKECVNPANIDADKLAEKLRLLAGVVGLPADDIEFVTTEKGDRDMAVFDFTSKKVAVKPYLILTDQASADDADPRFEFNSDTLVLLCGDSLVAPFWPQGTGMARGVLGSLDNAWMLQCLIMCPDPSLQSEVFQERCAVFNEQKRCLPDDLRSTSKKQVNPASVEYLSPQVRYKGIATNRLRSMTITSRTPLPTSGPLASQSSLRSVFLAERRKRASTI